MLVHTLNSWGGGGWGGKGEGVHRQLKRELRLLSIWQRAVTLVAVSSARHVFAADMRMREQRANTLSCLHPVSRLPAAPRIYLSLAVHENNL